MTLRRISRRTVLRGLGVTVAVPLLDVTEPFVGHAQAAPAPTANRLAFLYFPNGIPRGTWYPDATAAGGRDGNEHDANDLPTLLAGRGGGSITTGRFVEYAEPTDLSRLHLSLLQLMGMPIDRFGAASEPLPELNG